MHLNIDAVCALVQLADYASELLPADFDGSLSRKVKEICIGEIETREKLLRRLASEMERKMKRGFSCGFNEKLLKIVSAI